MALSRVWKYRKYRKNACKRKKKKKRKNIKSRQVCELWTSRSASRKRVTTYEVKINSFPSGDLSLSLSRRVNVQFENSEVSPRVLSLSSLLPSLSPIHCD